METLVSFEVDETRSDSAAGGELASSLTAATVADFVATVTEKAGAAARRGENTL